jgi:hypothetical protein
MVIVPETDQAYTDWLAEHPNNFVLNTRSRHDPTYMVLHRASCWTISPFRKGTAPGAFTQSSYKKVCSDDIAELRQWVCVHGRREGHAKLQGAPLHLALSDDALDLPLRGDAHLLEELANVYVEAVLIHRGLLRAT